LATLRAYDLARGHATGDGRKGVGKPRPTMAVLGMSKDGHDESNAHLRRERLTEIHGD
jgi:hypothetical protein